MVRLQYGKKYTQATFKMGSRSPNHSQIFASCHLCKLVQDYYKYRNSLTLLGVLTIAAYANSNVDVIAGLPIPLTITHDNDGFHVNYMC